MRSFGAALVALMVVLRLTALAGQAASESDIAAAQRLYENAAYADALAVIATVESRGSDLSVAESLSLLRYRLLCQTALDRAADAERTMARIVALEPFFSLTEEDAAPGVRARFAAIRRTLLRSVAAATADEGRQALAGRDRARAHERFTTVTRLLDEIGPVGSNDPMRRLRDESVRMLTDIAAAIEAEAAIPIPPGGVFDVSDATVRPPVPVIESVPSWPAYLVQPPSRNLKGLLEIIVDADGTVESTRVLRSLGRVYDTMVSDAARSWSYEPARKGTVAVRYRRLMELAVRR